VKNFCEIKKYAIQLNYKYKINKWNLKERNMNVKNFEFDVLV
jgi:hypothetical protein